MTRTARFIAVVLIVLIGIFLFVASPVPAQAMTQAGIVQVGIAQAPPLADPLPLDGALILFIQYASLAGFAALVAALVNVFKTFGIVKEGQGGKWAAALNLIGLTTFLVLKLYIPSMATEAIDGVAGQVAQVFLVVLGYVIQLFASSDTHNVLANADIPVIGKSFTMDAEKAVAQAG